MGSIGFLSIITLHVHFFVAIRSQYEVIWYENGGQNNDIDWELNTGGVHDVRFGESSTGCGTGGSVCVRLYSWSSNTPNIVRKTNITFYSSTRLKFFLSTTDLVSGDNCAVYYAYDFVWNRNLLIQYPGATTATFHYDQNITLPLSASSHTLWIWFQLNAQLSDGYCYVDDIYLEGVASNPIQSPTFDQSEYVEIWHDYMETNNGSWNTFGAVDFPYNSDSCGTNSCARVTDTGYIEKITNIALWTNIQLQADVGTWDLESNDFCAVWYQYDNEGWIVWATWQGDEGGDSFYDNQILYAPASSSQNPTTFGLRMGPINGDSEDDRCYFDNVYLRGITHTPNPTISTLNPSLFPTANPSYPTVYPSAAPTVLTSYPTSIPTISPISYTTTSPSNDPSRFPSKSPVLTAHPSAYPSGSPSDHPTASPSNNVEQTQTTAFKEQNVDNSPQRSDSFSSIVIAIIACLLVVIVTVLMYCKNVKMKKTHQMAMKKMEEEHQMELKQMQLTMELEKKKATKSDDDDHTNTEGTAVVNVKLMMHGSVKVTQGQNNDNKDEGRQVEVPNNTCID
eukprot:118290_1